MCLHCFFFQNNAPAKNLFLDLRVSELFLVTTGMLIKLENNHNYFMCSVVLFICLTHLATFFKGKLFSCESFILILGLRHELYIYQRLIFKLLCKFFNY